MSTIDWVENEVNIVKNTENLDGYNLLCLDSAVKAYKCLMEDGHSGFSIGVTRNILNKLLDEKPLTPINDTPETWVFDRHEVSEDGDIIEYYSTSRKSGLYKRVNTKTGEVTFHDVNRVHAYEEDSPEVIFYNTFISRIVQKQFPITFPYDGTDEFLAEVIEFTDWEGTEYLGIENVFKNHEECKDFESKYLYYEDGKPQAIDKDDFYDIKYYSRVKEVMSLPENKELKDSFEFLKNHCTKQNQNCDGCIFKRGIECLVCNPSHWDDEWNATFEEDEDE